MPTCADRPHNLITFDTAKRTIMFRIASFLLLCTFTIALQSQSRMSSAEISYLYDTDHEFQITERIAREGNKFKAFIRFRLNSGMVKISDYAISYDLRGSYIDEKLINSATKLDSGHVIDNGFREFTYAFEFETTDDQNLLILQIENLVRDKKFMKDITLKSPNGPDFQSFLIFQEDKEIPYFEKYINLDTKIRIKNVLGNASSFSIKGREDNESIAMPPFDESQRDPAETIPLDTVYGVLADEVFEFSTPGFYEISADADTQKMTGILVTDAYYPYYEAYTDLVKPLIYISSNPEFNTLQGAENPKMEFEDFVLNTISSNTNIAQDFVKFYYRRVRMSAQLFTESKAGWKTDRGMVYQIYGNPDNVFRNENTELWVYALETGGRTRFIFDILKGPGGIRTFKLIRGDKYRKGWMNAVTRWRSGRIIE